MSRKYIAGKHQFFRRDHLMVTTIKSTTLETKKIKFTILMGEAGEVLDGWLHKI